MKYKQSERIFSSSFLLVLLLILLSFSERKKDVLTPDHYVIKNKSTGTILHTPGAKNNYSPSALQGPEMTNNTIWELTPTLEPNVFQLQNKASGKLFTLSNSYFQNKATFMQGSRKANEDGSLWHFQKVDKNHYKITIPGTLNALTVNDEHNSEVYLADWENHDNQYWELNVVNHQP